jgi:hypothetical protein
MGNLMKQLLFAVGLAASLGAPASAAIYITTADVGPNVVFSFAGSLDLTGMTSFGAGNSFNSVVPNLGAILFAGPASGMDGYSINTLPAFGSGNNAFGTATGDQFKIFIGNLVGFAGGYAGETISGDLTVAGSAVTLGLIDGVYETAALSGDFIRLTIGVSDVPVPAAAPLLLGALGLFGLVRRKRA